jgi:hypothetical protein
MIVPPHVPEISKNDEIPGRARFSLLRRGCDWILEIGYSPETSDNEILSGISFARPSWGSTESMLVCTHELLIDERKGSRTSQNKGIVEK